MFFFQQKKNTTPPIKKKLTYIVYYKYVPTTQLTNMMSTRNLSKSRLTLKYLYKIRAKPGQKSVYTTRELGPYPNRSQETRAGDGRKISPSHYWWIGGISQHVSKSISCTDKGKAGSQIGPVHKRTERGRHIRTDRLPTATKKHEKYPTVFLSLPPLPASMQPHAATDESYRLTSPTWPSYIWWTKQLCGERGQGIWIDRYPTATTNNANVLEWGISPFDHLQKVDQ